MSILYLVGTPIGNLEDITYRAVRTLTEVDYIFCEDTRVTAKLCQHYQIQTPLKSYHEHNKDKSSEQILRLLEEGKQIALVSDAGCPCISDPGYELVNQVREQDFRVETIPGPNAAITALMTSGLPSYKFVFLGFLPRHAKEKHEVLQKWMSRESTSMIYESPYRIKQTVRAIAEIDPERKVAIGRELTKKFEQVETNQIEVIEQMLEEEKIPQKGEFVILIEGIDESSQETHWWEGMDLNQHVEIYIKEHDMKSKDAIKQVSVDRKMKKRDVYESYHVEK
ncbi:MULTISPECIES: 16S rRNA (cytidine(1402)-2'-O)-methyltransferase [Mammaliicoccus]|uniref:Ribosomal RNA small subunit methyltransferase I n=1 Tax=Mammaliicoccus fleurettii TaxID=150056 RepID=A0ABS5MQ50_9STAP|nr:MULTISPECIES: 16S rRNA (cytidine(1402)-2'-O)-methyltransferase [Mammaliicoccus]HCN61597.1 16S rRNA (cytidine(1402)-2'-O)-methyltransferase [Staphylococcus sp.]MBL0848170.1 16S rRNA (cytidine(1402)-2'-O)-methyltransferase [Mammaliicoccus fleurettii]MBO3063682.1 16S rRNA (cytidine(1402)-2'-O)-methyltransferase [Mammaliicoccus fleurettii]MBS3672958.1 16S rRNA (cytidine(1402)-2'-O)-methyltransferase [Mammaliicoccus fleurettii]MBS3698041.1 16S rRNA (cytidine(1402)-2'-O)-methyltransferase [Mammal